MFSKLKNPGLFIKAYMSLLGPACPPEESLKCVSFLKSVPPGLCSASWILQTLSDTMALQLWSISHSGEMRHCIWSLGSKTHQWISISPCLSKGPRFTAVAFHLPHSLALGTFHGFTEELFRGLHTRLGSTDNQLTALCLTCQLNSFYKVLSFPTSIIICLFL